MENVVSELNEETLIALCGILLGAIAILGGITVAITLVVSSHYRRKQLDEMEATLKMEMIQRGMAAEEIERVLAARMGQPSQYSRGRMGRDYQRYWQQYEQPQSAQR